MQILQFLISIPERVYAVFDTWYPAIIDAGRNAFAWARDKAAEALSAALMWINYEIGRVTDFFNNAVQLAKDWATTLRDGIVSWLNNELPRLWGEVLAIPAKISAYIKPYIDTIIDYVNALLAPVREWIDNLKAEIQPFTDAAKEWLFNAKQDILNIIAFFKDGEAYDIFDLLRDTKDQLVLFLVDPIGYIIAVMTSVFLDIAEDALADGLGSVRTPLPPKKHNNRRQK
jgi:hypothetical protein